MRQTGELIKRYRGDENLAKQYLGIARVLLGRMKAYLAGAAGSRIWNLADGVIVETRSTPFGDIVKITAGERRVEIELMIHGLFCNPISDQLGPEDATQTTLPAKLDENWLVLRPARKNTTNVGGNGDWQGTAREDRLTFNVPPGRYGPMFQNVVTIYMGDKFYPYKKNKIEPPITAPGPIIGIGIHRFMEGSEAFAHYIVSTPKTYWPGAFLGDPFVGYGITEIEFFWRPVIDTDEVGWQSIGVSAADDDNLNRVLTTTMFHPDGDRCCAVEWGGLIVEWVFTWGSGAYSFDRTTQAPSQVTTYSTETTTYFPRPPEVPFDDANFIQTRTGTSYANNAARQTVCADYRNGVLDWLMLVDDRTTTIAQDFDTANPTLDSSFTLTRRVRFNSGPDLLSWTITSTTDRVADGQETFLQDVSFTQTGTFLSELVVGWADVRSHSAMLETRLLLAHSFSGTNLVDSGGQILPYDVTLQFNTDVFSEDVLLLSRESSSKDVSFNYEYAFLSNFIFPATEDLAGMTVTVTEAESTDPSSGLGWSEFSNRVFYPPNRVHDTCTPIQSAFGNEFFLSIGSGHACRITLSDDPTGIPVPDEFAPFAPFNVLYLDDTLVNSPAAFDASDEWTNVQFIAMGSF